MESSEIKTAFLQWNKSHRRNAWRVSIDNTNADSFSWFGGHPTGTVDCAWPACAECTKPMRFFLQLDLASLPEQFDAPLREGILQLFYCSSDDGMCDTWEAFSGTHELRLVQKSEAECACPETVSAFAKSVISDWQIIEDAPSPVGSPVVGFTRIPLQKESTTLKLFQLLWFGHGVGFAFDHRRLGQPLRDFLHATACKFNQHF